MLLFACPVGPRCVTAFSYAPTPRVGFGRRTWGGQAVVDLVDLIFGTEVIDDGQAVEVFSVLAPVLELAPDDEEAIDAAARVIARMAERTVLSSVLDWWLIVTTGHKSANSHAYPLPEEITGDLRQAMEFLRDLDGDVTPAVWAASRQELADRLTELDTKLDLDRYGAVKLGGERTAWAALLEWLEPDIAQIKDGATGIAVELDEARFSKELRESGLDENSRRWKEMFKRATTVTEAVAGIADLVGIVEPRRHARALPSIANVPADIADHLRGMGDLLLAPVLEGGLGGARRWVGLEVEQRILRAAEQTDDRGRYQLADIVDGWLRVNGSVTGVLQEPIDELADIRRRVDRLDQEGVDVDETRLLLLDYEVEQAVRSLEVLEEQHQSHLKARQLEQRLETLRSRVVEEGLDWDDHWGLTAEEVRRLISSSETGDAEKLLQDAGSRLDAIVRDRRLQSLLEGVATLEAMDAPSSVTFDLRQVIADLEEDPTRPVSEARVAEVEGLVRQLRAEHALQARELAASLQSMAGEIEGLPNELRLEIEQALLEMREAFDHGDDDVTWIAPRATELMESIERRRVARWTADDGEVSLVEHVVAYCQDRMDFGETDIRRLYVAIKTKPFVIIAGLTGSGKSSIARLIAESMGATSSNGQFRRIAVRPDWIDQSEVLGFVNPTSQRFEPGWLADTIRACERQPDRIFFALLDEMNLAPVEQYLAEILSAMEEARAGAADVRIPLYGRGAAPVNANEWPHELRLPPNLVLIGTVNVDETTRPLSERVIDRANVLQLSLHWTERHHGERPLEVQPWLVPVPEWRRICRLDPSDRHHEFLVEVAERLQEAGIGVGLRAHLELERFLSNAEDVLDDELALDLAILQRIIPKVRAFKRDVADALGDVRDELLATGCSVSAKVLDRWLDPAVPDDEFLDGTDARVGLVRID